MKIVAPKTWKDLNTHFLNAVNENWYKVILEVENSINIATTRFYEEKRIPSIYLPITTSSISSPMGLGSDSTAVKIELFGVDTYLADSMQFMLEYGCRFNERGCYYILPSFRGEPADERHLCQFFHSEAEIPGKLDDVMKLVEDYIKYLAKYILDHNADSVMSVTGDLKHLLDIVDFNGRFPQITMADGIKELNQYENAQEYVTLHECGEYVITSKGEKKLLESHGGMVWLTHFPAILVPFYQAYDDSGDHTLNADLLFGIGEVVGCGERHADSSGVLDALNKHEVNPLDYEWYMKMKEKYPLKTSGFGMGIERFLLWVLKHNDIRDCQLLPRQNGKMIIS